MERLVRAGTMYEVGLQEMGLQLIREHLREAAKGLVQATTPAYRAQMIQESILFVRGTGLNMAIETFGIEVDADTFRTTFFEWAAHRRQHHTTNGH